MRIIFSIAAIVFSAMFVLSGFAGTASGGVEPSPFRNDIGKLNSMINVMEEVNRRTGATVDAVLGDPDANVNGNINKIRSITNQLELCSKRQDDLVEALGEELQAVPADIYAEDLGRLAVNAFALHSEIVLLNNIIAGWSEYDGRITPGLYRFADEMLELRMAAIDMMEGNYALLYLSSPNLR